MKSNSIVYIISNSLLKGGAEKQCVLLAKALNDECNIKIIVLSGNMIDSSYEEEIKKNKIQIIKLKGIFLNNLYELYKLFRKTKSKIFVFSYLFKGNFLNSFFSMIFVNYEGIGGFRSSNMSGIKLFLQRIFHNRFLKYTICNSYKGRDFLKSKKFKYNKLLVIPNTIDLDIIPIKKNKKNTKEIQIISVGRLEKVKDYNTALRAFHKLIHIPELNSYKIKYNIVGYGAEEKKILKKLHDLELQNKVDILINVNPFDYLKKADIYLSTSLVEGLSNALLEALAFKLPIVATDVGDNKELIIHGKNGFLSEKEDFSNLCEGLRYLVLNEQIREKFGRESFSLLGERFTQKIFKKKYMNLIEEK